MKSNHDIGRGLGILERIIEFSVCGEKSLGLIVVGEKKKKRNIATYLANNIKLY